MSLHKIVFLVIGIWIFSVAFVQAQLHDRPVIIDRGLPDLTVRDLAMDGSGYLWIGTHGGLVRYDGSSFDRVGKPAYKEGNPDPQGGSSLPDQYIYELLFDSIRNVLWVGTAGGLGKVDVGSGMVRKYFTSPGGNSPGIAVEAITLDADGQVWCSLEGIGLARYDELEDTFEQIPILLDPGPAYDLRKIRTILDLSSGIIDPDILWVGTDGGLLLFSRSAQKYQLHSFLDPGIDRKHYLNQIRTILPAGNGTLYLGTWSEGLIEYRPLDRNDAVIEVGRGHYSQYGSAGVGPPLIPYKDDGIIVNMGPNCIFNTRDRSVGSCISFANSVGKSIPVEVKFIDEANRAWAGSEYGVFKFDPLDNQFEHFSFPPSEPYYYVGGELLELQDRDEILITYEHGEGVYCFDRNTRQIKLIRPLQSEYLSENTFKGEGLVRMAPDRVLVLERKKLYVYDPSEKELKPIPSGLDGLKSLWSCFTKDHDGVLWLGTNDSGLVRFDTGSGAVSVYQDVFIEHQGEKPLSIHKVFIDRDNHVWIALHHRAFVFMPEEKRFLPLLLDGSETFRVQNFIQDPSGIIWAGTEAHGLVRIDPSADIGKKHVSGILVNGRDRENIAHIQWGPDNAIWMIVHAGLQRYDPGADSSALFTEKDGMQTYSAWFHRNPSVLTEMIALSDGKMAFAPRTGVTLFDPEEMRLNRERPIPYVKQVSWGDTTIRQTVASTAVPLRIPYSDRNIEFVVSALGYSQSQYMHFTYKLEGLMDNWAEMDNRRIRFAALSPGDYTFLVRVINSHGLVSEVHRTSFRMLKPWWLKGWVIGLALCLIGALVWAVVKARDRKQARRMERENEIRVLMAGLESKALRNQMNPHFLFNIFNTIQELILTGDTEKAYSYTSKFSKLLRMILDYARKDEISVEQEAAFLKLYLELEALRFDDAFTYQVNIEPGIEFYHMPVFMVQPLVENAIRHGLLPKNGDKHIHIRFGEENGYIICTVTDNGLGLQTSPKGKNRERDHALGIIEKRLEVHRGGHLKVRDRSGGVGVESKLCTPIKK